VTDAAARGHQAWRTAPWGTPSDMFFFFSNRLGCLGSLLLSAAVTVVLILLLNR
jgi:hypothetical protein